MKKISSILLILLMMFLLIACTTGDTNGELDDEPNDEENDNNPNDPTRVWKQAMLAHNGVSSNSSNFNTLFTQTFDVEVSGALTLYTHKTTGTLNFLFAGQGEWSIIRSVLTLDSDFETIVKVSVYEHNEQYGAIIQTDPTVLAAFVGKKFDPTIVLVNNPSAPNEVLDGFTGVTGTKNGFLTSLNSTYAAYYNAFGEDE